MEREHEITYRRAEKIKEAEQKPTTQPEQDSKESD
jgi:hypothetical protein